MLLIEITFLILEIQYPLTQFRLSLASLPLEIFPMLGMLPTVGA